jgi:hypothetical protein
MMILAAIVFSGISLLVWFLATRFVSLGGWPSFFIFLGVGPLYLLAAWLTGMADEEGKYGGNWTLPVGRILAVGGITVFAIMAISPFFESWRAVSGFWLHLLLVFIGLWIISLLIHALGFLLKLFTA